LIARYDRAALRVEASAGLSGHRAGPLRPHQEAAWNWLQAWCFEGAGDGRSPPWRPRALPQVPQRWSVAWLAGPKGSGRSHLAEAFSRQLDGDDRLQALASGAARLRLRIGVKLADACWWRARRPDDPWDCGYLVDEPAARQALQNFLPRRATLMVADGLPEEALRACVAALAPRQARFRQPVRLLVIATEMPAALARGPTTDAGPWRLARA